MYNHFYSHEFNNILKEEIANETFNKKVTWLDRIINVLFK